MEYEKTIKMCHTKRADTRGKQTPEAGKKKAECTKPERKQESPTLRSVAKENPSIKSYLKTDAEF